MSKIDSIDSLRRFVAGRRVAADEYEQLAKEYRSTAHMNAVRGKTNRSDSAAAVAQDYDRKAREAREAARSTLRTIEQLEAQADHPAAAE